MARLSATLIVLISSVMPQRDAAQPQIVLRSQLVIVPVTARDRDGQYIRGLKADDFEVYDNGKRQQIAFFSAESNSDEISRPLALVLLLDGSGSVAATLHEQRSAAESLLNQIGRNTLVSVIRFSAQPEPIIGFTDNKAQLLAAFAQHGGVGGDTAIFDALLAAIAQFREIRAGNYRKVIILLSDGMDTASRISYRDCAEAAEQQGVSVYTILIPVYSPADGRLEPRRPSPGFAEVAREAGGRMFQVGTVKEALDPRARIDLTPVLQNIVDELRNQYYIGYYAPRHGGYRGYHQIRIRTKRAGIRIEVARRGYYER